MPLQETRMDSQARLPCAGCRMLHRRCGRDCMLAPYFPSHETEMFAVVHKVFGASNVIKMLQMVGEPWREDAVKSMVYEAYARLRNPVYGCTVAITNLQRCVEELEEQLRATREQILRSQEHTAQLSLVQDSIYCPTSSVLGNGDSCDDMLIHGNPFTVPMDQYEML